MLLTLVMAVQEHTGFQTLTQRLDIIDFWQKKMLHVLDRLCENGGIDMLSIPGYDDPPPHQHLPSPSNLSVSSPGLGVSSLALADTPPSVSSRSSSRAAGPCEYKCTAESRFFLTMPSHSERPPEERCKCWTEHWECARICKWESVIPSGRGVVNSNMYL